MNTRFRRKLSYLTLGIFYFAYGVEYAVIFPTLWAYLLRLHMHHEYVFGLAIAAYSLSGLLTAPIIGYWFDRSHNSRIILLVTNMFEIAGSFMYFFAFEPWFVVLSRLVCGLGSASSAAITAEIAQCTSVEDRTPIITVLEICRQAGLLFGPAFNLLLRKFNFLIGPFEVNKYTVPGLFMVVIWLVVQFGCLFLYSNLGDLQKEDLKDTLIQACAEADGCAQNPIGDLSATASPSFNADRSIAYDENFQDDYMEYSETTEPTILVTSPDEDDGDQEATTNDSWNAPRSFATQSTEMIVTAENIISSASCGNVRMPRYAPHIEEPINYGDMHRSSILLPRISGDQLPYADIVKGFNWRQRLVYYADEFLRDDVIALLNASFLSIFVQACLETMVTPMMNRYYGYEDFENSLLYLFGGLQIMLVFIGVSFASRKVSDRTLIVCGSCVTLFSLIWMLVYVPYFPEGDRSTLVYFVVGVMTDLLGIPPLIACSKSLYSKIIRTDYQGVGQSIRQTFVLLGLILGPIWAGVAVHTESILFGTLTSLMVVSLLLIFGSFSKLKVASQRGFAAANSVSRHSSVPHERTPLLAD